VTAWTEDHFIAGDLALDFANTVYRRTPELGADLLDSPETLAAWLDRVGLPADGSLAEARVLRGHLWALLEAQVGGHELPTDALAGLLDLARRGGVSVGPDGSVTARTRQGALTALALHGLRLALSPLSPPVRTCDRCGWFFVDTSRGRRRRWCSMKTCGNQAKAARFRSVH
jgi:predicted RNA-binding Zn ribbon-like protein